MLDVSSDRNPFMVRRQLAASSLSDHSEMSSNLFRFFVLVSIALIPTTLCKTCTKEQRFTYMIWKMDPFTQKMHPQRQAYKRIQIVCCEGYTKVAGSDNSLLCEPICKPLCRDGFCDFNRCHDSMTTTSTTAPWVTMTPTTTTTHRPTTLITSTTTINSTSTATYDPTTTSRTSNTTITTQRPTTTITTTTTTTTATTPTMNLTTTTVPTISSQREQLKESQKPVSQPELSTDKRFGSVPASKSEASFECEGVNCVCPVGYTLDNESLKCKPLCNGKIYGCHRGTCIGFNQCRCDEDTYLEDGELFHCRSTHFQMKWPLLLLLIPVALIVGGACFAIRRWKKARAHRLNAQSESFPEVRLNNSTNHSIDDKHMLARYTSNSEDNDNKAFLYWNDSSSTDRRYIK